MKFRETYNGEKFIDLCVYIYIYISRYVLELENGSKICFQKKTRYFEDIDHVYENRKMQKIGKYLRTKRDRNEALNGKEK